MAENPNPPAWDRIVDVVVVGSGGAALVAATLAHDGGAETLVVEKAAMLGGTTAVSGGGIWLPGNHHMEKAGLTDSREDTLAYIDRVTAGNGQIDREQVEAFVDAAPKMLAYLEEHTPVRTHITPLPDYYSPWGVPGQRAMPGRAVEADPYAVGSELPEWADKIVSRGTLMSLGAATTLTEDFSP
ncbi:MAG: FAD-binding protein, partial [Streptomycetaceae bacterium]|nr:FAD-binding protein [Streptomycetaceae bacterium]